MLTLVVSTTIGCSPQDALVTLEISRHPQVKFEFVQVVYDQILKKAFPSAPADLFIHY